MLTSACNRFEDDLRKQRNDLESCLSPNDVLTESRDVTFLSSLHPKGQLFDIESSSQRPAFRFRKFIPKASFSISKVHAKGQLFGFKNSSQRPAFRFQKFIPKAAFQY
jgi:hypothetical protein